MHFVRVISGEPTTMRRITSAAPRAEPPMGAVTRNKLRREKPLKYFSRLGTALLALAGFATAAHSTTFTTASGATNSAGGSVSAEAEFTFGTNSLTVLLTNLLVNQNDVAQNVSGLRFDLSGASGVSLASSGGLITEVAASGSYSPPTLSGALQWYLQSSPDPTAISVFGHGQPDYTILGAPGGVKYSNANHSIAGNGPHNPFVFESATFVFAFTSIAGVDPTLSDVQFSFGTTGKDWVDASCTVDCGAPCVTDCRSETVPEPATLALVAVSLAGAGFARRRRAGRAGNDSRSSCGQEAVSQPPLQRPV